VGETLLPFAVWIGLSIGVPLICSICNSNKSPEPSSPHGDPVAQYTVTYYADGAQEWEEVGTTNEYKSELHSSECERQILLCRGIRRVYRFSDFALLRNSAAKAW
jgi:hypothetical protein